MQGRQPTSFFLIIVFQLSIFYTILCYYTRSWLYIRELWPKINKGLPKFSDFVHLEALMYLWLIPKWNVSLPVIIIVVLIDTNNNTFTTSPYEKPSSINTCTLNCKSQCPNNYKITIIQNLINYAKANSSTKKIFYTELKKY